MADRYRRESRDRDYTRDGYSSRSHSGGHSTFSYSHRRSPSPGFNHHSRRHSPPPATRVTPIAPSIHTMLAHSSTNITLDERFTALKRTRSASPSPPPRDSMSSGSAKSRQYLDELSHRSDVLDKIESDRRQHPRDRERSPMSSRAQRPSNGSQQNESHSSSRSERLEATKRIAASRSRGSVHSRLGINRTVGSTQAMTGRVGVRQPSRDGGANANNYSQFVKHSRPQQQQQQHQQQQQQDIGGQKRVAGKSAADLDSELDEYMKQRG